MLWRSLSSIRRQTHKKWRQFVNLLNAKQLTWTVNRLAVETQLSNEDLPGALGNKGTWSGIVIGLIWENKGYLYFYFRQKAIFKPALENTLCFFGNATRFLKSFWLSGWRTVARLKTAKISQNFDEKSRLNVLRVLCYSGFHRKAHVRIFLGSQNGGS